MNENSKPSSRTLDALIAPRMGWLDVRNLGGFTQYVGRRESWPKDEWQEIPNYQGDLTAAFEIEAILRKRGFWLRLDSPWLGTQFWIAAFAPSGCYAERVSAHPHPAAAIVLAALRALGVSEAEIQAALAPKEGAAK